jgi:hypothetical protein
MKLDQMEKSSMNEGKGVNREKEEPTSRLSEDGACMSHLASLIFLFFLISQPLPMMSSL